MITSWSPSDPKKVAENPDFTRLLGQSLTKLAITSRFFGMLLARTGQQFTMRLQFVQNARARDANMQFVPPSRYFAIGLGRNM